MYVYIILPTHPEPNSVVFAPTKQPTSEKSTFCKGAHFPSAKKATLLRGRLAGRGWLVGSMGHRRIGGSISRGTIVLGRSIRRRIGGSIRRRIGGSIRRTVGWRSGIGVLDWGLGRRVLVQGTLGGLILIRRRFRGVVDDRSSHRRLVRSRWVGHWVRHWRLVRSSRIGHRNRRVGRWSSRVGYWSSRVGNRSIRVGHRVGHRSRRVGHWG
jgi:hypothetical protein